MDNVWPDISELVLSVKNGEATACELVEKSLNNIEKYQDYNSIIAPIKERSVKRAKQIDENIKKGKPVGRLAGVPFVAKDNFLVFGAETTAASNILSGFDAPYQSTVIEKLEAEGAICVAKANLDAFAHGSSTENSDIMITKNPHDKSRVPGGSSGGSAAAVALNIAPFALGTDTGGSIRLPASFCGVVGYKPTYGLVSRSGVIAMASSTDVIGPITKTVKDASLILDIISGKDPLDSTTIDRNKNSYADFKINKKPIIGVVKEYFSEGLDKDVKKIIEQSIDLIKNQGYEVKNISLPSLPLALACYYVLCPAEISSNLSRYDGQRFGFSDKKANSLEESYLLSRTKGFGKEAKRRIMIGTYVLTSGYYDAYYKQAQIVRTKLINEFNQAFNDVDLLLGPTAPSTAFKIGQNANDTITMYLTDIMTVAANLVGIPAISLPVGKVNNLPVGLQLMAKLKADDILLASSAEIERIMN